MKLSEISSPDKKFFLNVCLLQWKFINLWNWIKLEGKTRESEPLDLTSLEMNLYLHLFSNLWKRKKDETLKLQAQKDSKATWMHRGREKVLFKK